MLIKTKQNRLVVLLIFLFLMIFGIIYSIKILEDNILYFFSPTQINQKNNIDYSKKISPQYNKNVNNIRKSGTNIDPCIEVSPLNLILEG